MIDPKQLRDLVVVPALRDLARLSGMQWAYSSHAVNLIMGTIAQESKMGLYIHQLGKGPALGICQMEPATYSDIWEHYLRYKPDLGKAISSFIPGGPVIYQASVYNSLTMANHMVSNLMFSVAMARVHYMRVRAPMPKDKTGYAAYWKKYYNTNLGAGTVEEFLKKYDEYVVDAGVEMES